MHISKVSDIIAKCIGVDTSAITLNSTIEELQIDALSLVDIIMDIEDEFATTIDDSNVYTTVGDIVACLDKALELQSA